MIDADDLIQRLRRLGDALEFGDAELADSVVARLDEPPRRNARPWLVVAAAVLVVVLVAVALVPDSRRAVARWFGLDGVTVQVDPAVSGTAAPISPDLPGPGESRVIDVDGQPVLVSTVSGTLSDRMITKAVQSSTQVQEVDVEGAPGLWISGPAHEIGYESPQGNPVFERMAGNTLLWQRGDVITRVEGFDDLASALTFAREVEKALGAQSFGT